MSKVEISTSGNHIAINSITSSGSLDHEIQIKLISINEDNQDESIIHFKFLITEKDSEREVEFDYDLLEDCDFLVAEEMIEGLKLPKEKLEHLNSLICSSVDSVLASRASIYKKRMLERAELFEKDKLYQEAEFMNRLLLEAMGYPLMIENGKPVINPCDDELYNRILSNLAYINYKLKRYDIAKSLFKRQIGDFEKDLDVSQSPAEDRTVVVNQSTIKSLLGLAKVYVKVSKDRQAERLLKRICISFLKLLNKIVTYQKEESQLLDRARKAFVKLYEKQGKLYESENIYKRVFEEKNAILLQCEEKVEKLVREGKFEEGQSMFKDSAKLKESLIPMLERLTELYMKHNKYVEALSYLSRLLDLKEKLRDPEHFSLVETLCKISNLYQLQQRYDVADATFQKALKIAEKSLQSNENMIRMLVGQSKLDEANKAILRNLEIKKVLIVTLTSMIDLYQVMNKLDDLANLKKRLAEAGNATTSMQSLGVPTASPLLKKS